MSELKAITNELIELNIDHALKMAYLRVTDVLIKCNELDYDVYAKLRNQVKHEINRLNVELIAKLAPSQTKEIAA